MAEVQKQLADQEQKLKEIQGNLEEVIEQKEAEFDSLVSVNKEMQEQIERREAQIQKHSQEIIPALKKKEAEMAKEKEDLQKSLSMAQEQLQKIISMHSNNEHKQTRDVRTLNDQIQVELEELRSKNANFLQIKEERDQECKRLKELVEASQARERKLQMEMQSKLEAND